MRHREHISALAADEKQARLMRSRAAFRFSQHAKERKGERAAYALAVIKLFTAQEHYFLSGSPGPF
jgi:hypothetical protein